VEFLALGRCMCEVCWASWPLSCTLDLLSYVNENGPPASSGNGVGGQFQKKYDP
jgi:hypothetical protein